MGKQIKVLFTLWPGQWLHKVFRTFIVEPPQGVTYVDISGKTPTFGGGSAKVSFLVHLFNLKRKIPWLIWQYKIWEERRVSRQIDEQDSDIVYCVNGRCYHGEKHWVVDFENPTAFTSFSIKALKNNRERLRKIFLRKNCKAIIAYSQTGRKSFVEFFGEDLADKAITIENAINLPKETDKIPHKGFNLLFTGSANIDDNFYGRGGGIVARAFAILSKKHSDMKLTMRIGVPETERKILEGSNVVIREDLMSAASFQKMFRITDVYLFPSYYAYALTLLEVMAYGIPAVISDHLDNKELITNNVNGIKITPPKVNYVLPHVPDFYFDKNYAYPDDPAFVDRVVKAVEKLYDDRKLIEKLGENAKKDAKNSTVAEKNKKLLKLFRRCVGG